ncbi:hypothetical protein BaRGS_00034747 [Batillaria attramentaria]|uniref:Uncharacterized protein n=1 Tax=Batillaria attramentaria TaxID=370345 RepID=A0ABD0JGH3_9CAEN
MYKKLNKPTVPFPNLRTQYGDIRTTPHTRSGEGHRNRKRHRKVLRQTTNHSDVTILMTQEYETSDATG